MNYTLFVACAALCAVAATAQEGFTVLDGPGMRFEGEPVKNAPYSAEAVTESVQALADGNRIRRENRSLIYRDSQGRTRREESITALGPWATDAQQKSIFINDPVAGTHYVLNPNDKSGARLPVPMLTDHVKMNRVPGESGQRIVEKRVIVNAAGGPGPGMMTGAISAVRLPFSGETKEEDLGTRAIEGVTAVGTKMTTTIPAKEMGAERDIVITFERWHSPELKVDVLTKRSDPRVGETTYRLTNLNRTEPLPSLFEPPADFDINQPPKGGTVFFNRKLAPPQE